jgi:hypothetical protein
MLSLTSIAQLIVAVSVVFVWVFRYFNVVREFKEFGLSDLTRNAVGATKIALSTILALGVWYSLPIQEAAWAMGALMLCAQFFHFKVRNSIIKFLPSFFLLLLSVYIATQS